MKKLLLSLAVLLSLVCPAAAQQVDATRVSVGGCLILFGTGTPEAAVAAPVCSLFLRSDGTTDTTIYKKETGAGANTGWVAIAAGGGGGGAHAILSATHTDTVAASVVRGDLMIGNSTPAWARVAKGTSGFFLKAGASDTAWADLFGTSNTWSATQLLGSGSGSISFQLLSRFADSASNDISWVDSSQEHLIKMTSGATSPSNSFEVSLNNTDAGTGDTMFLAWRWLGGNGGGNVEHTPRSTAVLTAAQNAYGYWLKPAWTEATSGTHALVAGMRIDTPNLINGTATTTETATFYVQGASTQGVSNYAVHVAAGVSKFDGSVVATPVAFASVPTGVEGMMIGVTDSTTVVWGATITGGGANHVLAYFDGTNWTVAGK